MDYIKIYIIHTQINKGTLLVYKLLLINKLDVLAVSKIINNIISGLTKTFGQN